MLPILVRPECSSSTVVATAFHPERASYFLLAFADGIAAVFDAIHFFRKHDKKDHATRPAVSGVGGLLAFMKGLHAHGTSTGKEALQLGIDLDGVDPGTGIVGIGDKSWGITAVAFVPGRKATVITVGADGKCCVVDFTQESKKKAVLLKTWHLRRPATSLSVVCTRLGRMPSQTDGAADVAPVNARDASDEAYYIAIGRQDGRVLLFDLNGKPLGEQTLDENGAPVLDVEWTQIEGNDRTLQRRNSSPAVTKASGSIVEQDALQTTVLGHTLPMQVGPAPPSHKRLFQTQSTQATLEGSLQEHSSRQLTVVANHLDLIEAPATVVEETDVSDPTSQSSGFTPTTPSNQTVLRTTVTNSAGRQYYSASKDSGIKESTPPAIPPRPSPRPGGLLSMRRAQSSYESPVDNSYSTLIATARRAKSNAPSRSRRPLGPRPMPSVKFDDSRSSAVTSDDETSSGQNESYLPEVPPRAPPPPPPHAPQIQTKSPTASVESFQTASSHVHSSEQSETSTDTVIDWDVGATRQPFSSLNSPEPQPPNAEFRHVQPKNKAHISLSIPSTSRDTSVPISSPPTNTTSPIIQWPAASPVYSAPGLHATHRPIESPGKAKVKRKGHVSVALSSASDDTITPISSASGGAIVQWPSLKKSPRIPDLGKGLSVSKKEASTALASVDQTENNDNGTSPPKTKLPTPFNAALDRYMARASSSSFFSTKLESVIAASMAGVRDEMAVQFAEQRRWLEGLIRSEDEGRGALEEENLWLRRELGRGRGEGGREGEGEGV